MAKFEIGKTYTACDLYANSVCYKVINRDDSTITVVEWDMFCMMDEVSRSPVTYGTQKDSEGNEFVEFYYDKERDFHSRIVARED